MITKKDASLDALFDESGSPAISETADDSDSIIHSRKGRGRPREYQIKRQQIPVNIPESLYFELLDWVNLKKRDNKRYSMNEVIHESIELWLKSKGKPTIQEIVNR